MRIASWAAASALPALISVSAIAQRPDYRQKSLAPYVSSPQRVVDKMLELAGLKPGELLYDLGCGDGRVLITAVQKYRAKAVGVELSPDVAKMARENIRKAGIENRVKVIEGNLLDVDVSPADVVVIYLLTQSNDLLRPKLERSLRPGARVISHDYKVPGWNPSDVEKAQAYGRAHTIYVYEMPGKN